MPSECSENILGRNVLGTTHSGVRLEFKYNLKIEFRPWINFTEAYMDSEKYISHFPDLFREVKRRTSSITQRVVLTHPPSSLFIHISFTLSFTPLLGLSRDQLNCFQENSSF
jgi:hypothetical protein